MTEPGLQEAPLETERAACPLCGSGRSRSFLRAGDVRRKRTRLFSIVECADCRFRYSDPRPTADAVKRLYTSEYPALAPERLGALERAYYRAMRLFPCDRPGTLLDIGCGNGKYLSFMKERGWRCSGQDVSAVPDFVREEFVVYRRRLQDCGLASASFDAITLWWSLEHLPDPLETLLECRRLLAAGGTLVVGTSNSDSLEAALFGRYWHHLHVPEHFSQFTPGTLSALVAKAGFRIESLRHDPVSLGFSRSLRHVLESRGADWPLLRLSDPLSLPFDALAALARRSALITLRASP